jgi:dTDP-4-dehydrorhamnose reductase
MIQNKILVIGKGFLGSHLILELKKQNFSTFGAGLNDKNKLFRLDVRNIESIKNLFNKIKPDIVINCAALTNLDYLEENPEIAFEVNSVGAENLAIVCNENDSHLIHISTDGIFDGKSNKYDENSIPNPINVYGKSKLQGEINIQKNLKKSLIVRTNFFGYNEDQNNLFTWIYNSLKQKNPIIGFDDVFFNPLNLSNLSHLLSKCILNSNTGIINLSNDEIISKYNFALKIAHKFNFDTKFIKKGSIDDIHFIAKRPLNTSLSNIKAKKLLKSKIFSYEESFTELKKEIPT